MTAGINNAIADALTRGVIIGAQNDSSHNFWFVTEPAKSQNARLRVGDNWLDLVAVRLKSAEKGANLTSNDDHEVDKFQIIKKVTELFLYDMSRITFWWLIKFRTYFFI